MLQFIEGSEWCIFGAFACGKRLWASSCLSAWNNSAPTGWIFKKFDIYGFFENLLGKISFRYNLTRITGTLYEDHYTFLIISHSIILRMKSVQEKCRRENQNVHFMFNHYFFENRAVYEIMWKSTAGHRRQYGACTLHAMYLGLQTHTQYM
jgi:hypothetical protein